MVLIGGQPAARMGDMHVCPMLNPGVPPPPHVGGPIMKGSATVLIGGMPAARMGDMATCAGPPDSIVGGCPTVLIGDSGGGGGGAGGGGGSGGAKEGDRETAAAEEGGHTDASSESESDSSDSEEDDVEGHFLDVQIVDKGGFPITGVVHEITHPDGKSSGELSTGVIQRNAADEGDYDVAFKAITQARWSTDKAKAGDKVKVTVSTVGVEDGTPAQLEVWLRDIKQPDQMVTVIPDVTVKSDGIEREWAFEYPSFASIPTLSDGRSAYSLPQYFFKVRIGALEARSALITFTDKIVIEAKDEDGNALKDEPYVVFLSNGEVRDGKLDSSGKATLDPVPAAIHWLRFPNFPRPEPESAPE